MREVPFYPSPAEREAQRQEIIAELARKYSISLPAYAPIEDAGKFFCPFLAQFSPEDYVQFVQVLVGEYFDGQTMEAHEQMRKELRHDLTSFFRSRWTELEFQSCAQLHCFAEKYNKLLAKKVQTTLPAKLAPYILEENSFLEILAVEVYILQKKIALLHDEYSTDIQQLNGRINGFSDGLSELYYDLAYFDVRLCVVEYVVGGKESYLRTNFSPTRSIEVPPALPALRGRYKELLEERLAHFELACQHQKQMAEAALAVAIHDVQTMVETFRGSNKLSQRLTLNGSMMMQAGKVRIELWTGMYWNNPSIMFPSALFLGFVCLMFFLADVLWGIPVSIVLFLFWIIWQQR